MTAEVAAESRKRASNPNRGSKPGERRGGRKKGTPNRLTKTIKEAIEVAFDEVGGPAYLVKMAQEQPTAFLTLLGKVIPTQLEHSGPNGEAIKVDQVKSDADAFESSIARLAAAGGAPGVSGDTQH